MLILPFTWHAGSIATDAGWATHRGDYVALNLAGIGRTPQFAAGPSLSRFGHSCAAIRMGVASRVVDEGPLLALWLAKKPRLPHCQHQAIAVDVAPGDLIHMDENGAVKFPPKHAPAIVKNAQAMLEDEARRLVLLRKAKTAAEVRAASSGGAYTPKKA